MVHLIVISNWKPLQVRIPLVFARVSPTLLLVSDVFAHSPHADLLSLTSQHFFSATADMTRGEL